MELEHNWNGRPYHSLDWELKREFDTSKLKRILQSLETGLFFCQIFVFII